MPIPALSSYANVSPLSYRRSFLARMEDRVVHRLGTDFRLKLVRAPVPENKLLYKRIGLLVFSKGVDISNRIASD